MLIVVHDEEHAFLAQVVEQLLSRLTVRTTLGPADQVSLRVFDFEATADELS
jgi:hypothetical protein